MIYHKKKKNNKMQIWWFLCKNRVYSYVRTLNNMGGRFDLRYWNMYIRLIYDQKRRKWIKMWIVWFLCSMTPSNVLRPSNMVKRVDLMACVDVCYKKLVETNKYSLIFWYIFFSLIMDHIGSRALSAIKLNVLQQG